MAEDQKPESTQLNLTVKSQDGDQVQFKVKSTTKFEKIFAAYCNKKSVDRHAIRFLFDGARLDSESSPQEIGMEDGDIIDAMQEQVGGCCGRL
uniref:Small ubiquitin-related modifier n=1 Tax=Tetraselmis sp. GSL018 TaxID=582737 RepID=A0A061SCP4_9CHLO|mmetsp:Transcript_16121/g.38238  ORF Transcript_16121/g.38238 Transcript_16121/m.38238 type:complete len:93 (-) Transcript_16121:82-360(-)|eukprot:CAMPEP_0177611488 /NCGR_PEP_ID=MMETSP0419_2-20121207/20525_1 /TAXON_ID=582737 /ORGANISM="Tetraselmis sp., Strain GSL018" /LENGTH=92 /DNA_ID=CAMNT_0019107235 /DNA_START=29 /DNA_END=307 /DNA_ORIENTATION=-